MNNSISPSVFFHPLRFTDFLPFKQLQQRRRQTDRQNDRPTEQPTDRQTSRQAVKSTLQILKIDLNHCKMAFNVDVYGTCKVRDCFMNAHIGPGDKVPIMIKQFSVNMMWSVRTDIVYSICTGEVKLCPAFQQLYLFVLFCGGTKAFTLSSTWLYWLSVRGCGRIPDRLYSTSHCVGVNLGVRRY